MLLTNESIVLPNYYSFSNAIALLNLPISCSEVHGVLCGYLVVGGLQKGETYLRALVSQKDAETRLAVVDLFHLLTVSQHQLSTFGFDFQLFLPEDDASLLIRAQAFSEWCEGFIQGLTVAGLDVNALETEEAQEAVEHISEFSELDYDAVCVNEEDERALMEVIEYTRMAVLALYSELQSEDKTGNKTH